MSHGVVVAFGCTAALLAEPAAAVAQLPNGGFDQAGGSLTPWALFNNVVPNVLSASITARSGPGDMKLFGGFNGSPNYSGAFQGLPAEGGQTWRARAYVRHNSDDSLAGTQNNVLLKIEFYRVFGGAWGTADLLQETAVPILDGNTPVDAWICGAVQIIAPPGTVEARVVLVFTQNAYAAGAALIDDVAFDMLPVPWNVVWQDQFSGAEVDSAKWNIRTVGNPSNNELQYYLPDEVYVEGGNLVLRSQDRWYGTQPYTSGSVTTLGKLNGVYGRWEVRAKLPYGKGFWPAHWLLPVSGAWPPEIDIMEMIGDVPWRITMSQHWGPLPPGTKPWDIGQTAGGTFWGPDFTQDFHTFAIEWFPGQLHWYIDNVLRASSIRPQVPNEPMYLILNTAVGGDWPGSPDGSTPFPAYHLIDYVRVSVPSDAGAALTNIVDTTSTSAIADGAIATGEYAGSVPGINYGLGDRIGRYSTMSVDSSAEGQFNFAFHGAAPWFTSGLWGVVIYVDSVPGGFPSTFQLADTQDLGRRLASGKGTAGQRADLFFAPGFTADYAIVLQSARAELYQLGQAQHVLINGAELGATTDLHGGPDVVFRADDGSAGLNVREFQARLWQIGVPQGGSFRCFATMLNGDSAFRANEFIGVAPGNSWDGVYNPAQTPVVLKPGDFVEFQTSPRRGDFNADGHVDYADFVAFAECMIGPAQPPPSGAGLNTFDFDTDGDIDLVDFGALQSAADGSTGQSLTRFSFEDSERDTRALLRPVRPVNSQARGAHTCQVV
jgi:beta-glucanase (GH16 family)